jgi:hypothetical protein
MLTPSFFIDSLETKKHLDSTNKPQSDEKSTGSSSSFKVNKEHCLNIFNSIKNFNERLPLTSAEKRQYKGSLEMINERDEECSIRMTK